MTEDKTKALRPIDNIFQFTQEFREKSLEYGYPYSFNKIDFHTAGWSMIEAENKWTSFVFGEVRASSMVGKEGKKEKAPTIPANTDKDKTVSKHQELKNLKEEIEDLIFSVAQSGELKKEWPHLSEHTKSNLTIFSMVGYSCVRWHIGVEEIKEIGNFAHVSSTLWPSFVEKKERQYQEEYKPLLEKIFLEHEIMQSPEADNGLPRILKI